MDNDTRSDKHKAEALDYLLDHIKFMLVANPLNWRELLENGYLVARHWPELPPQWKRSLDGK